MLKWGSLLLTTCCVLSCSGPAQESALRETAPHAPAEPPAAPAKQVAESENAVKGDDAPDSEAKLSQPQAKEEPKAETKAQDDGPRLGSTRWYTFIYETPKRTKLPLGGVRIGTTVKLKSAERVKGWGCTKSDPTGGKRGWYAVEPYGYVCADQTVTFDFDTPLWKLISSLTPGDGPYPYEYAYSMGANMYNRVPTKAEWERAEWGHKKERKFKTLGKWAETHEKLVIKDPDEALIEARDPVPEVFENHEMVPGSHWNQPLAKVRFLPAGSGVSYSRVFEANGRTWLLTPDLLLVPADKVFKYEKQTFKGIELKGDKQLPLAWVTSTKTQPKFTRTENGLFAKSEESGWGNKAHVLLTGAKKQLGAQVYWETKEDGFWIQQKKGVAIVEAVSKLPGLIKEDERWLDARVMTGYAVAYEGLKPVWTTLWSAGKGGVPAPGKDTIKDNIRNMTTSVGIFGFQWKEKVATMSPDVGEPTVFWFADVPHIQYVKPPLALHVSYWHENYGNLMSAECLNFSPADAEWLFDFTLPAVPKGWNAVRGGKLTGESTRIVLRPL